MFPGLDALPANLAMRGGESGFSTVAPNLTTAPIAIGTGGARATGSPNASGLNLGTGVMIAGALIAAAVLLRR